VRARSANLLLLLAGLALGLLAAEAAARLLLAQAGTGTGYAPVNTRRRWGGPTNSRGYRDDEHALAKPPGTRRLLALGDSFTWGVGVEFEDAWPQRLQRMLARRSGGRWEAVSLARPGMNTVEQAEQLEAEALAYAPDVVVLGYCLNDSEDDEAAELRRARDWEALRSARQRGGTPLVERSALVRVVAGRVRATLETRRRVANYRAQYDDGYAGWRRGREALARMAAACRGRDVPLVVAVFPLFGNPLDGRYPFAALHGKVAAAAGEAGARVVDLLPFYRELRPELLVVDGANDEHPNEIAHRIAANAMLPAVEEALAASTAGR
jgi:lysophospholipase L1-like esterase